MKAENVTVKNATGDESNKCIQIANLDKDDRLTKIEICNIFERWAKKWKIPSNYIFLHIDKYKRDGKIKYSLRARVKTSFGLFVAKSFGWNLLSCIHNIIKKIEREMKKRREKAIESERKAEQKIIK